MLFLVFIPIPQAGAAAEGVLDKRWLLLAT
jgi:hypothetical protein